VKAHPERFVRLDLAWPERKLACEYDGVAFHTGDRLFEDRARLNSLVRLGWTVVHVTAAMVFKGRRLLVQQIAEHLT
jgi:very-short-patch-repair endonuclease